MLPYLKEIGVTVKIQQMEGAAMVERNKKGEFQTFIWSMGSGPDILGNAETLPLGDQPGRRQLRQLQEAGVRQVLNQGAAERDPAKQIEFMKQANNLLFETRPPGSSTTTRRSWLSIHGSRA